MTLPKSVQLQLEAAEALQAQLNAPAPVAAGETTQVAPAPVVAPAPPAPPQEDWEQKFRTLQGKYHAEVPQVTAKNKTLEAQVIALTEQVQALTKATQQAKPPEKPPVDPRDVEQFGQDLVEMVTRNAQATITRMADAVSGELNKLSQRVSQLEGNVNSVVEDTAQTKEAKFYEELAKAVPEWQQINQSAAFHRWLETVDPVYGVPRQTALTTAHDRLDGARVVAIFNQFLETVVPTPTLDSQTAPRTTNAAPATAPAPATQRTITSRDVEAFYRDVTRGKYRQDPEGQLRREAEINAAIAEGRVINVG